MAAFTLTNARALLTNPITASVGGRAAKAAVCNASRSSVPAFARVVVPARSFGGLAVSGVAQSRATVVRAFHFTAMSMDEEGGDSAGATEGPVKLYVGNLSWGVDDASLGDMFADFSASDMTVVKDNESGRSRGFGFVTLTNQAEADKAIAALDGMDIDGRPLRVNISVARGDRPERAPRPDRGEKSFEFDARKIYFGNLSWGMDHLDLQDLCGEFGVVEDSRLITDRETGRSRGFGFVTMATTEEAEEVVRQLNGQDVDGRVLRVNIANVDK